MTKSRDIRTSGDELFDRFKAEWPTMFEHVRCGFDLPPCWEHIVWTLCGLIDWESQLDTNKEMKPVTVNQVKSKFGGLRFYISGGNNNINCFISMAENLSMVTCGWCGMTSNKKITSEHSRECGMDYMKNKNNI